MTLVRYNPLTNFVPGTFGDLLESALNETREKSFTPAVDIIKTEKEVLLYLLAPGMDKKDFTIDLDENELKISGERNSSLPENAKVLRRETNYGTFERVFTLSEDIDKEKINASYEAGILKLTLPFVEKKVNKATIKVK